jgi:AraC-like DNA-binding protein
MRHRSTHHSSDFSQCFLNATFDRGMRPDCSLKLVQLEHLQYFTGAKGAQLTRLFDFLEDVQVWVKDRRGRYVWVNRAFLMNFVINEKASSAALAQVQGKTDYDLCPRYLADQYQSDDELVLAGQSIINRIELVGERDGLATWNVTNKIPLAAPNGSVIGTAGLTRHLDEQAAAVSPGTNFGAVLNYLRDGYRETITNSQLARLAGLSVRAFERKFIASFQVPPQKFLKRLRLRMAGRALVFTRQSIVEVALRCGFADQSHFTREFHRHFGRTPRDYREWYARSGAGSVTKSAGRNQ